MTYAKICNGASKLNSTPGKVVSLRNLFSVFIRSANAEAIQNNLRNGRDSMWQDRSAEHVASISLIPTKSLWPMSQLHPQVPSTPQTPHTPAAPV